MNIPVNNIRYIFFAIVFILVTHPLSAQDSAKVSNRSFSIHKGTVLTGFSITGITASRDDFNHEFERSFSRLRLEADGLYFLGDRFGIGPVLGYEYLFRDFEDPSGFFNPRDQWKWNFLYGAQAGWYLPIKNIFRKDRVGNAYSLSDTYFFIKGGVNWLWNRQKTEGSSKSAPNNRIGYRIGMGLLVPVGDRISLEWELGWEGRQKTYLFRTIQNGQIVVVDRKTRLVQEFGIGLGLQVTF